MTLAPVPWWIDAVVGLIFGCAAYLAIQMSAAVCRGIEPFEDGPEPATPPANLLIGCAALVGALAAARFYGILPGHLLAIALVVTALVACTYSDILCGIVPFYFTLVPLVLLLALDVAIAFVAHDYTLLIGAAIVTVPFAGAALFSKGIGMGWGDVKIVAMGGLLLGQPAILVFAAAGVAAVVIAAIRKRRHEPIAFVPYLAGAIALAVALPVFSV